MDEIDLDKFDWDIIDQIDAVDLEQKPIEYQEFDRRYQYSQVPMEIVERNIEEYVIPELQEACKSLWARNIFTVMCSNRNDGGAAYILLEPLSEKNKAMFEKLKKQYPKHYTYDVYRRADRIQIEDVTKMTEQEISNEFMKLCEDFILQDVQSNCYKTAEDYLVYCGCYDETPNPKYKMPTFDSCTLGDIDINDLEAVRKSIMEFDATHDMRKTIKTFNKNKMTKSFEDYLRDNGDEDKLDRATGNVYQSAYFLKKHLDYVNSQKQEQTQEQDL